MPRRADLDSILVIGSGPIVIGQACEFDYSGTQAIKALRADGCRVILVNSNPATIMTDPEVADRTYIEPLTPEYLELVIAAEHPRALLPTVGGQTALNLALALADSGVLAREGVELIGARAGAIRVAEDRELFRRAMADIGLETSPSLTVGSVDEAAAFGASHGFPLIVRPSFTLGGSGGGIAYNADELVKIVALGLSLSPIHQVLVEQSLLDWKEYELEVMRDQRDNVVIVCSIENLDPMGVHTGDSITVAPAQTLTDAEYQRMRDAAAAILRQVGVDTGGANVQFAIHPRTGQMMVIEMNPRVSRSSALASKATGFPIAKIAAKLALGYSLDEIPNDITKMTPACFEPALDYVVTKIPKFTFEKFSGADATLGTQMKSVGEVMAIGRTLRESLHKAIRALESGETDPVADLGQEEVLRLLRLPNEHRLRVVIGVLEQGWSVEEIHRITRIDPWFVDQLQQIAELQRRLRGMPVTELNGENFREAKAAGFADRQIARLTGSNELEVRRLRHQAGVRPVYKCVDTCAAEFVSSTPYLYSTYDEEDEAPPEAGDKVIILGSGPNRIGQGIEFDYCCCHAAFALRDAGVKSIMVNCNPETVSTDYDTSDRLYFEPVTFEDVMAVVERERPRGVIVQFGGQTPLNLVGPLHQAGVPILGTPAESIDLAEDRERFNQLLDRLGVAYPPHGFAHSVDEAQEIAGRLGYPVLVRPSYVLGGRAMAVVHDAARLGAVAHAASLAGSSGTLLIDKFLEDAYEFDVDALADGEHCIIAGIMQHIEHAGVHSGDSAAVLPPYRMTKELDATMRATTRSLARALGVVGLVNIQFAVAHGRLYVIEANPRASRTVPFIAKGTGVPLAKVATRLMLGATLAELGLTEDLRVKRWMVKAPVFPFAKFPGADPKLSPEMKSTGEVMGMAGDVGMAYFKALLSAGLLLPFGGKVLLTVNERDKDTVLPIARRLHELGFSLAATRGTAQRLAAAGLEAEVMLKLSEGRPNLNDAIKNGEIAMLINTPLGAESFRDGWAMRTAAVQHRVPAITTLSAAAAAAEAIAVARDGRAEITCLQDLYQSSVEPEPSLFGALLARL